MKQFIKSLQELTKIIRTNEHLDTSNFDLIILANLSAENLSKIRSETKDIELIHCHEFWDFTEEIYKNLMIPTISKELKGFLSKLIKNKKKSIFLEYKLHSWKEFVLTTSDSSHLNLLMNTVYAEGKIQEFLNHLQITDKSWIKELYDFDYKYNFESEVETLLRELVFKCWQEVAKNYPNEITGSIREMNGGSHLYDLHTGNQLN